MPPGRVASAGATVADGAGGDYEPTRGRIYDLGGEGNRVVLFPITDHPPLPCEAFEYSVWLSNDPDATETATPDAPDPRKWNPARLIRAFTQGWTRNPTATGAAEALVATTDTRGGAWRNDGTIVFGGARLYRTTASGGTLSTALDADTARFSPEFESCKKLAAEHKVPLKVVYEAAQQAYRPSG